jgi:hypothetical protein
MIMVILNECNYHQKGRVMKANGCFAVFLALFLFTARYSYGDNKVVVIPMNSSSPAVVGFIGGDQYGNLTTHVNTTVRSLTLEVPGNGLVIVNASGNISWFYATDKTSAARCSITQGITLDSSYLVVVGSEGVNGNPDHLSFALTRAFPVEKGSQTFNLVCNAWEASDYITYQDTSMNAVYHYVPDNVLPGAAVKDVPSTSQRCDLDIFCK